MVATTANTTATHLHRCFTTTVRDVCSTVRLAIITTLSPHSVAGRCTGCDARDSITIAPGGTCHAIVRVAVVATDHGIAGGVACRCLCDVGRWRGWQRRQCDDGPGHHTS